MTLDMNTLTAMQKLIESNFTGRDELYAAAESLDDESREHICRRLADHLAANAIELQQILKTRGVEPAGPLDSKSIALALFDLVKLNRGESGVLNVAAEGEQNLKQEYDQAIEKTSDQETVALLRKQREDVKFGEEVLGNIERGTSGKTRAPD
jgi:uncharacterized protein (TIGR02284 family)